MVRGRRGEVLVSALAGNEGGDAEVEGMGTGSEDEMTMTSCPGSIVRLLALSSASGTGPTVVICCGMGARGRGGSVLLACIRIVDASDTRLFRVRRP